MNGSLRTYVTKCKRTLGFQHPVAGRSHETILQYRQADTGRY
jgi:hypothetical protein